MDLQIKCVTHKNKKAKWECSKCHKWFCNECVTGPRNLCPACRSICIDNSEHKPPSFYSLLGDAFLYPFKGKGIFLLIIGPVYFSLMKFAGIVPVIGWLALLFGTGFLCAYMFDIVGSSAKGEDEMPDWPDVTDLASDLITPFLKIVLTFLISFGPVLVYVYMAEGDTTSYVVTFWALLFLGILYFPMSLIATSLGSGLMLNPYIILRSIARVLLPYLLSVGILTVLYIAGDPVNAFLVEKFGIAGLLINGVVSFYLLVVEMRILGVLYYSYEDKLGWFT